MNFAKGSLTSTVYNMHSIGPCMSVLPGKNKIFLYPDCVTLTFMHVHPPPPPLLRDLPVLYHSYSCRFRIRLFFLFLLAILRSRASFQKMLCLQFESSSCIICLLFKLNFQNVSITGIFGATIYIV